MHEPIDDREYQNSGGEYLHPLGSTIPDWEHKLTERVPVHATLGPGHILGVSGFLKSKTCLPFRARTQVTVQLIRTIESAAQQLLFMSADKDGSGSIDFKEFSAMKCHEGMKMASLRSLFDNLDADGSGEISALEFSKYSEMMTSRMKLRSSSLGSGSDSEDVDEVLEELEMQQKDVMEAMEGPGEEPQAGRPPHHPPFRKGVSFSQELGLVEDAAASGQGDITNTSRRAWLVMKRLNMLQCDWRCIEINPPERCFINKLLPRSASEQPQSRSAAYTPQVTEQQMLEHGDVRKRLNFDDIEQVNRHALDLRVTITFLTAQRPYQMEFSQARERDEFLNFLRQFISKDVFKAKTFFEEKKDNTIREDDLTLMGRGGSEVPDLELADFYRGLCLKLTIQLDRTRTECIRLSRLRALTDTDALMEIYDEREQLRLASIKIFGLPGSEKMVLSSKCFLTTEEEGDVHMRRRLIVLTNFLVMDTAIFGPAISRTGSTLLRLDQLYEIYETDSSESDSHAFFLKSMNDMGTTQSWKIAFATASSAHQVRISLSDMCSRARHLRQTLRDRPFEDPVIKRLIEKCGTDHLLLKGQELVEVRESSLLMTMITMQCRTLLTEAELQSYIAGAHLRFPFPCADWRSNTALRHFGVSHAA